MCKSELYILFHLFVPFYKIRYHLLKLRVHLLKVKIYTQTFCLRNHHIYIKKKINASRIIDFVKEI